jgi:hypothetical protein
MRLPLLLPLYVSREVVSGFAKGARRREEMGAETEGYWDRDCEGKDLSSNFFAPFESSKERNNAKVRCIWIQPG